MVNVGKYSIHGVFLGNVSIGAGNPSSVNPPKGASIPQPSKKNSKQTLRMSRRKLGSKVIGSVG